jgi:hypothetical protein
MMNLTNRSNASFFNNTIMQGGDIQTEIDHNEESMFHQNPNLVAGKRLL